VHALAVDEVDDGERHHRELRHHQQPGDRAHPADPRVVHRRQTVCLPGWLPRGLPDEQGDDDRAGQAPARERGERYRQPSGPGQWRQSGRRDAGAERQRSLTQAHGETPLGGAEPAEHGPAAGGVDTGAGGPRDDEPGHQRDDRARPAGRQHGHGGQRQPGGHDPSLAEPVGRGTPEGKCGDQPDGDRSQQQSKTAQPEPVPVSQLRRESWQPLQHRG